MEVGAYLRFAGRGGENSAGSRVRERRDRGQDLFGRLRVGRFRGHEVVPSVGGGDLIEGIAPNLLSQLLDELLGRYLSAAVWMRTFPVVWAVGELVLRAHRRWMWFSPLRA